MQTGKLCFFFELIYKLYCTLGKNECLTFVAEERYTLVTWIVYPKGFRVKLNETETFR